MGRAMDMGPSPDSFEGTRRIRRKYDDDERPYMCEYCNRTYAFANSRDQHIRLKHVKNQPRSRAPAKSVLISGFRVVRPNLIPGSNSQLDASSAHPSSRVALTETPQTTRSTHQKISYVRSPIAAAGIIKVTHRKQKRCNAEYSRRQHTPALHYPQHPEELRHQQKGIKRRAAQHEEMPQSIGPHPPNVSILNSSKPNTVSTVGMVFSAVQGRSNDSPASGRLALQHRGSTSSICDQMKHLLELNGDKEQNAAHESSKVTGADPSGNAISAEHTSTAHHTEYSSPISQEYAIREELTRPSLTIAIPVGGSCGRYSQQSTDKGSSTLSDYEELSSGRSYSSSHGDRSPYPEFPRSSSLALACAATSSQNMFERGGPQIRRETQNGGCERPVERSKLPAKTHTNDPDDVRTFNDLLIELFSKSTGNETTNQIHRNTHKRSYDKNRDGLHDPEIGKYQTTTRPMCGCEATKVRRRTLDRNSENFSAASTSEHISASRSKRLKSLSNEGTGNDSSDGSVASSTKTENPTSNVSSTDRGDLEAKIKIKSLSSVSRMVQNIPNYAAMPCEHNYTAITAAPNDSSKCRFSPQGKNYPTGCIEHGMLRPKAQDARGIPQEGSMSATKQLMKSIETILCILKTVGKRLLDFSLKI